MSKGARDKGKRLEYQVRDLFRRSIDPKCERQVLSGGDAWNKGDIRFSYRHFPFMIECKNQERYNFWAWWDQVKEECSQFDQPVVIFTKNHKDTIACMKVEHWMDLLEELHDYRRMAEMEQQGTCDHEKELWKLRDAIKKIKEYLKIV